MFAARWRWIANISLALPRFRGGRRIAAPLQRMRADDLMASVFPDQAACADNIVGDREIPDHPLVRQAIDDCLHEAMDIDGLIEVLHGIESGAIEVIARDMPTPSPLALEVLTAKPYAYLDDAPLEERRTQAVMARRWLDPETASDLGKLDQAAIERVRAEAWPAAETADELHDALVGLGFLLDEEIAQGAGWSSLADKLVKDKRATWLAIDASRRWLVAAERLPQATAVHASAAMKPRIAVPAEYQRTMERDAALVDLVRSRLEGAGPVTVEGLASALGVARSEVDMALGRLAAQGIAMSGHFTPGRGELEWCDRGLLARIHRYTVRRLREEIEPVATQDFMRFLLRWQHLVPSERREGPDALDAVITQLQGFEAPAAAWEAEILPARLNDYDFTWLDDLCLSGRAVWTRLTPPGNGGGSGPIRTSPIALLPRRAAPLWNRLARREGEPVSVGSKAQRIADFLASHGASFFDEIVDATRMLRTEVEEALGELVAAGLVISDSFSGLRALLTPSEKRRPFGGRRGHRRALWGIEDAGRWSLRRTPVDAVNDTDAVEPIVHALLRRYGVVFWKMLQREAAWLPPWRDMLHVLRRLEARGDIRGGRFVAGVSGEQFATPDAVKALRDTRRQPMTGELIAVSGADPLNLTGVVLPGAKVPALTGNRIVYRDGAPIATLAGGEMKWIESPDHETAIRIEEMLQQRRTGTPLLAYLR
jgi:ATP-dependent Lhr-like helicase